MNANLIFLLNLLSTWYLVGLIWMVQVVHYKIFDRVGTDEFVRYEASHTQLITPIVMPPMLVELVTAVALLFIAPVGFPKWAAWVGLSIVGVVWLTTFCLSVPCHDKLLGGFDSDAYHQLVNTNWIRTIFWTLRGILTGYFALQLIQ